jgi:hypothetical protein
MGIRNQQYHQGRLLCHEGFQEQYNAHGVIEKGFGLMIKGKEDGNIIFSAKIAKEGYIAVTDIGVTQLKYKIKYKRYYREYWSLDS